MADVTSQLKDIIQRINTAVRGEDVRDAIIEAINLLKTGDGNAYSLNGHPATYFATQDDMDKILPMDATPTRYSQRTVSSGGIFDYLDDLCYAIDTKLLNEEYAGPGQATLRARYDEIFEIKKAIRAAINAKGPEVTPETKFSEYANKIRSIENNPNISVSEANIGESSLEWDADKGEYTGEFEAGENAAYNPINVEIKPSLGSITLTDNGTFKAKDQNLVGFSEVTVDISESSGSSALTTKNITSADFEDSDTVTYKASDEKKIGYSQVSVDVSGLVGEKSLDIDPTAFGEQNIFEAKDDGLHGYSKITVTLVESEGPFTVKFYDNTNLKQTVTGVPKGGRANYTGPKLERSGMIFAGWNPSPDNVTKDMDCYAEFKTETEPIGYDSEIPKTWTEIAANGGADIPIGAYKILYHASFTYDGVTYPGGSLVMQKVYAGEDGTTSTWLSMNGLLYNNNDAQIKRRFQMYTNKVRDQRTDANGWEKSDLRQFLNNDFASAITRASEESSIVPKSNADIVGAIQYVKKYSCSFDQSSGFSTIPNAETEDRIWIPSVREACLAVTSGTVIESAGPIYTVGKTPSGETVTPPPGYASMQTASRTCMFWHDTTTYTDISMRYGVPNATMISTTNYTAYIYRKGSSSDDKESAAQIIRIGFCT